MWMRWKQTVQIKFYFCNLMIFLKTICWVIIIDPKENLATSAFYIIYRLWGHREGKIIAPLMGQLLSIKLTFECWKKNISRFKKNPQWFLKPLTSILCALKIKQNKKFFVLGTINPSVQVSQPTHMVTSLISSSLWNL